MERKLGNGSSAQDRTRGGTHARRDALGSGDSYADYGRYLPGGPAEPGAGGPYLPGEAQGVELSFRQKVIVVASLVLVGLLSFFVLGEYASSPEAHSGTIEALDQKKDTVMTLVAGSSGTSTAITLLPGDAGTPIAEKLVDISSDFLVVIAAIYLEKYLLTIIGFATFKVIIPIGCALLIVVVLTRGATHLRAALVNFVLKAALVGIAMYLVVPVSVFVSSMIESTYETSLNQTISGAQQTAEAIEQSAEETGEEDSQQTGLLETLQSIPEAITQIPNSVSDLVDQGKQALNNFIEALAVMIVTSCLIPILVLLFFLWLVKSLLGVSVDLPMQYLRPRTFGGRRRAR